MRADEPKLDVWSLSDPELNTARPGRKSEKHGFLVKNLQQITGNSGTDSRIELGNGALDAHERAGEEAMLCDRRRLAVVTV